MNELLPPEDTSSLTLDDAETLERAKRELAEKLSGKNAGKYACIALAALGSIPWVAGIMSAAAAFPL